MAAALTEYDSNSEIIEEARYGELVFEYYGWGNEAEIGTVVQDLGFDYCTQEQLGLKSSDSA